MVDPKLLMEAAAAAYNVVEIIDPVTGARTTILSLIKLITALEI